MRIRLLGNLAAMGMLFVSAGTTLANFNSGMIAVSFGSKDALAAGKAVVGSEGDKWNSPEGSEGKDLPLTNVKGAKTAVRLTFDADRTYDAANNSPFAGGPYENLMRHYLVATQARSISLEGLTPSTGYVLYLYSASDPGGDRRTTKFTIGKQSRSTTFAADKSVLAQGVNFARFPAKADGDGKIVINYGSEGAEGNLNGLQIMPASAADAAAPDAAQSDAPAKPKGKLPATRSAPKQVADADMNHKPPRKKNPARLPSKASQAEWPYWLGPNHDGKSLDQGLLKEWPEDGPPLAWQADGIGTGFSSAAVAGGIVYVTGDKDGKLFLTAFDMDGKQLWNAECGRSRGGPDGARSSPVIDGGNIYVLDGNGLLGCYDQATGAKKWQQDSQQWGGHPGGWGYAESPLVVGEMVVFKPGGKNCIVALDKTSGDVVWKSSGFDAGPEYGSCIPVTFAGEKMIVTGTNRGIVAVDARTGKLLWSNDWSSGNTANCPTPAYADGYIFWANGYGKGGICLKLSKEDGKVTADVAWKTKDMVCHHGGYIIQNGYIYGNHDGGWTCLDLKTGQKMWNERAVGKGSLSFADDMLYLFSENNGQAALATCSPQGLRVQGKVKVKGSGPSWAHPVVVGGRLYLRYDDHLYCFDVKLR